MRFHDRMVPLRAVAVFLLTGSIATDWVGGSSPIRAGERPNVLFVFLDDFGWRDAGFMGSDFYETPHLDRLAAQGMVFTDAYANASNCAPSRACLLSGQYTPRHEIYNVGTGLRGDPRFSRLKHIAGTQTLRTDIRTWADVIRDAGYATGTIGKWHLSHDPLAYGFDFNFAGSHSGSPPRGYFPPHPGAPGLADAPAEEYLTDRLNDEAIGFIRRHRDRPWLLYLTHFAVHTPLEAKPDLLAKYQKKPPGELHSSVVMAAMIESVDEGIGRIVGELERLHLSERTVIVFTSDNGGYGPATSMSPLKGYKGTYYEGGIRAPFFVKWPGVVPAGSRCEVPIIHVDLFPTLCEITGATLPDQPLDGVSLLPLLTKSGDLPPRALFWHFPAYLQGYSRNDQQRDPIFRSRPCGVVRDGDWKLLEDFETGELELYNLRRDIGESDNLVNTDPGKAKEMHKRLVAWRRATGAPVPTVPNPRFDPVAEGRERKRLASPDGRDETSPRPDSRPVAP